MKVGLSVPGNKGQMRATDCPDAVPLPEPSGLMILSSLPFPRISIIPWSKTAFPQSVSLPTGKHPEA
jgi:hypothetical protein